MLQSKVQRTLKNESMEPEVIKWKPNRYRYRLSI